MQEASLSDSQSGEAIHENSTGQETLDAVSDDHFDGNSSYSHDSEDCEANYASDLNKHLLEIVWGGCQTTQADIDQIRILLDNDRSLLDFAEVDGRTALHLAARYGLVDIAQELVNQRKKNIAAKDVVDKTNGRDSNGYTPLHYASWYGHIGVVELLLKSKSSSINATGNDK
ncbi:hypothetical protein NW761_007844 [Fusarium oxysporum]|nr:hypothetical protein NW758_006020 [Fusarium oxysporum]KAJ4087873.1 hypothetical protein NW761_007844 [Fusarium oxysporum]